MVAQLPLYTDLWLLSKQYVDSPPAMLDWAAKLKRRVEYGESLTTLLLHSM